LHGDVKVANFAILAGGHVSAFDWAMAGTGPCTIDLGWYLAVNASRLTGPKDQIVRRYRTLLETALGNPLPDSVWRSLESVAIVCGARMLLWSKALALDVERPGAREEWTWWVDRLAEIRTESIAV
jgi:aminoglycoside phosphotransferase (APT) family kinase protein